MGELPPRARRIRLGFHTLINGGGTTSACAENTLGLSHSHQWGRNYLRVRGEYAGFHTILNHIQELPPRARRILTPVIGDEDTIGTTSACAENTMGSLGNRHIRWNYLRVRGEYE